jgi:ATP synthase F1 delta subunit
MSLTNKIAYTYAKALFQNVVKGESRNPLFPNDGTSYGLSPKLVRAELRFMRGTCHVNTVMADFLKNPTYLEKKKLDIFESCPGLSSVSKAFLKVLTERSHISLIPAIHEEYEKIFLKFEQITKVRVVTANPLLRTNSMATALQNTLLFLTDSKDVILNMSYHSRLLGGLILEFRSIEIDASILTEFSCFFNET